MKNLSLLILLLGIGQMVLLPVGSVQGQTLEDQSDSSLSVSISYASISQFETDLENQGSFDVNRQSMNVEIMGPISQRITAGLELTAEIEEWEFTNLSTVAGATPWDTLHQYGISLPIFYAFNENWTLGIIPTAQFSGESEAEVNDSLIYGGSVLLNHIYSRDLQLGIGFCAFSQLEETLLAPFLLINWQVNDQLRISNPTVDGPAGPAGLEVVYSPSINWEFAIGGAYRHYRFRLSENNDVSNGVGHNEFGIAFLRLQRKLGTLFTLNVYGGALFDGKLSIEDAKGGHATSEEYDLAPMAALKLSCEF